MLIKIILALSIISTLLLGPAHAAGDLEQMTDKELLEEIKKRLEEDEETFGLIPMLAKEKDASGAAYYTLKLEDSPPKKVDELDIDTLRSLAARIRRVSMTKAEIVEGIKRDIEVSGEDTFTMVTDLARAKDEKGVPYYTLKVDDGPAKRLEDMDKLALIGLQTRIQQAKTIIQAQRIQRQLEVINRSVQNVQRLHQVGQPPQIPRMPQSPPQTVTAPPRVQQPPQPPPPPPRRP